MLLRERPLATLERQSAARNGRSARPQGRATLPSPQRRPCAAVFAIRVATLWLAASARWEILGAKTLRRGARLTHLRVMSEANRSALGWWSNSKGCGASKAEEPYPFVRR